MKNQKQVWNKIATEWHEFKTTPSEQILEFLKKQTGKVLDLGSGSGRHLTKIKKGKMYLLDFSEEMINLAKKRAKKKEIPAEFYVSNMTKLPFEENFFDSAICISSLHCIKGEIKREKAIKELFRVLKPKAKALISVWNKDSKRFKNAQKDKLIRWRNKGKRYYYLYEEQELHDLIKKKGFNIFKEIPNRANIIFIVEKPISS